MLLKNVVLKMHSPDYRMIDQFELWSFKLMDKNLNADRNPIESAKRTDERSLLCSVVSCPNDGNWSLIIHKCRGNGNFVNSNKYTLIGLCPPDAEMVKEGRKIKFTIATNIFRLYFVEENDADNFYAVLQENLPASGN